MKLTLGIILFSATLVNGDVSSQDSSEEIDISDSNYGNIPTSFIDNAFNNRRTFQCQLVKGALRSGDSGANISPEDIDIVAAMGDAISTGIGLWAGSNIEFRGAAFTIGGDATIDGLVTFPNILHQFNPVLEGISHGMGAADQLPQNQFNVASTGAETDNLESQSIELIQRLQQTYSNLDDKWVLVFITVGTEEMCAKCDVPNMVKLRQSIIRLKRAIPKVLVVLIGPVHVAKSSQLNYNLLKPRCKCLEPLSNSQLRELQQRWAEEFLHLEMEFTARNYSTFTLLALPQLKIDSRKPEQLFVPGKPLLNRKGHTYAAKWLWNRMVAGPKYNASKVPLSEDSYYCPPVGCPYFRTPANFEHCTIMTLAEFNRREEQKKVTATVILSGIDDRRRTIREHVVLYIIGPVVLSAAAVIILGTIFYCHGMKQTKGRFENAPGV
ncbi:unnamed protein product [Bursaphelenchus okinawaensis]|uniref:Lipase_GDSL domain-containing protein n=1 Tax=Bursaphelenchus okinawaensis TaxID=465554 RepID=A0A811K918_9BILA|nr:unnamed protein product [Bursaphelenchus okinawaensis]CAG9094533.1 unnamed protein product [Bursaphelenchus okinawaensis]